MDTGYIYAEVQKMAQKIDVLGLSQHAYDQLYWNGYETLGKLSKLTVQDILKLSGIGKVYCAEIVEKAASAGIFIQDKRANQKHYSEVKKTPYPQNLLFEIWGLKDTDQLDISLDSDCISGISFALHYIDERAATITLLRYKHHATFNEIGNYFGISDSRTQQIIDNTIKRLRHPFFRTLITEGLTAHVQKKISREVEDRVATRLKGEYLRGYYDGINEAKKDNLKGDTAPPQDAIPQIPIEDMGLSVRAFNCLKRAGIQYLSDLLVYQNLEDIYKIRNMGKISAIEIAKKIQSYGFIGTVWDEYLL